MHKIFAKKPEGEADKPIEIGLWGSPRGSIWRYDGQFDKDSNVQEKECGKLLNNLSKKFIRYIATTITKDNLPARIEWLGFAKSFNLV